MQLLPLLRSRFESALSGWIENAGEYAQRIAVSRDARHGDYQANIAMPLKKELNRPPLEIAQELVERLEIDDLCHPPEIAGPGFINLKLKEEYLVDQLRRVAADERLTVGRCEPKTYVIDYSAPNVAKPMHVGHIRSTVIGDALTRILRFLGHRVISDNHLGDWGTQFGMIIYGYKHFVDVAAFEQQPVAELSRIYRIVQSVIAYQAALPKQAQAIEKLEEAKARFLQVEAAGESDSKLKKQLKAANKGVRSAEDALKGIREKIEAVRSSPPLRTIAEQHLELEKRAQQETVKLHSGDAENLGLWRQFLPISIAEIEAVYARLDIRFDYTLGESFYQPMLAGVVDELVSKGLARENEGAICVFLDGFDAPMIIRKRDGAFLYATTDLATIQYRQKEFAPDAILYVVDHRQSEHFDKLFSAARTIGYDQFELHHVSFGTVLGKDGKPFKTRSGTVIGLGYLLDEAVERAYQVVCEPERLERAGMELSDEEKKQIANVVGLGAIKYADLSHNRTSDYKFDIDEMVQLEGETAAYIQYSYARIRSILRKSELELNDLAIQQAKIILEEPAERDLVLQLLKFEDALLQVSEEFYPSVLTAYLYALAKHFATFFDRCHVLNAPNEQVKLSRLVVCTVTARVLKQGLELLGIGVVDRM